MVFAVVVIVAYAVYFVITGGGMELSATDIAGYASNAGFTGSDLVLAVAVALAESSGNPAAVGDQSLAPTNGPSIGLWQINTGSKAHPEMASLPLTDPQTNANAAYQVYQEAGNSFTPWSTYNNGLSGSVMASASAGVTKMQENSSDSTDESS